MAGLLVASASSAAQFNYSAVSLVDSDSILSGSFGYNTATSDTDPLPDAGEYLGSGFWSGNVTGGSLDGMGFSLDMGQVDYLVWNNDALDGDILLGVHGTQTLFELGDSSGSWFDGDGLPEMIDFMALDWMAVYLGPEVGINPVQSFEFTQVSAVPVPPAIWLFGSALAGFIGWSRRRRNA
ncbi:MAG: PEP-CTERM sorting domain-containing protein [Candidatus Thiodiazotropha sp.]